MKFKEFIESKFHNNFIDNYFEHFYHHEYWDQIKLRYNLCDTKEKKLNLTLQLIEEAESNIIGYTEYANIVTDFFQCLTMDNAWDDFISYGIDDFSRLFEEMWFSDNDDIRYITSACFEYFGNDVSFDEMYERQQEFFNYYFDQEPEFDLVDFIRIELELVDKVNRYNSGELFDLDWFLDNKEELSHNDLVNKLFEISDLFVWLCLREMLREFRDEDEKPMELDTKRIPDIQDKKLVFSDPSIINKLYEALKGYFPEQQNELLAVLKNEKVDSYLIYPNNGNQLVEVFKRLHYNGYLINQKEQTKEWICLHFMFRKRGLEPQKFSPATVHDILTKVKVEPSKKNRICNDLAWLPHKNKNKR